MCARRCTRLVIARQGVECAYFPNRTRFDEVSLRSMSPRGRCHREVGMVNRMSTNACFDRKALALSRPSPALPEPCQCGGGVYPGWCTTRVGIRVGYYQGIARAQPMGYMGPLYPPGTHISSLVPIYPPGTHIPHAWDPYSSCLGPIIQCLGPINQCLGPINQCPNSAEQCQTVSEQC